MDSEYDILRQWLVEISAPGTFQRLDTRYNIVSKLAAGYNASPSFLDTEQALWRKFAEAKGIEVSSLDNEYTIIYKLADQFFDASPSPRDTLAGVLTKILRNLPQDGGPGPLPD